MTLGEPGQGTRADILFNATSEDSAMLLRIVVDNPMPEASLPYKRAKEPKEEGKQNIEKKQCS